MTSDTKNKKLGVVYIVHHVDTEGPLYESVPETFKRLESILNIIIPFRPTKKNLEKILRGELKGVGPSLQAEIRKIANPHSLTFNSSWEMIDAMLRRILKKEYRDKILDSFGNGWIYNWHILDHAGFKTNKRRKDLGYLNIFNHYEKVLQETGSKQDAIHWHFHPIPFFREAHITATSYENSYTELHQVLCRRLIEKKWFPRVNRAGFHTERPDSNWFLEQWIPFDPSNQSMTTEYASLQLDNMHGRYGDWTGAPSDWSVYHPDIYDWRKKGALKRVVARTLNLNTRFRNITVAEIEKAFAKAADGENVYLGITNHDFRDMEPEIDTFREMLLSVAKKFPDTKFKFSESVYAFRQVLGYSEEMVEKNALELNCTIEGDVLMVKVTNGEPFGPQPYLAIKTKKQKYFHDNFDFGEHKKTYFYTFDRYTIPLIDIESIAVASNDIFGNTAMVRIDIKNSAGKGTHERGKAL